MAVRVTPSNHLGLYSLIIFAITVVVLILSLFAVLVLTDDSAPIIIGEPNDKQVPSVVVIPSGSERTDARVDYQIVHREDKPSKPVP